MMKTKTIKKLLVGVSLLVLAEASAFAPTNFFPPYDPALRLPPASDKDPFRIGLNIEWGETHNCRNWDGDKHNVLQIHNDSESSIAALYNPTTAVATADFLNLNRLLRIAGGAWRPGGVGGGGAFDDGVRGHIRWTGHFEQVDFTPHLRYEFPFNFAGHLAISAMLPIRHAEIDDTHYEDLTGGDLAVVPAHDLVVQQQMTNDIRAFAKKYGNLDLTDWDKTDIGDLTVMLDWFKDFEQNKEALKNVELHAKLGVSFPTGLEKDEDKAFSLAFGNDGAWGLPFGIGLDLDFKYHIALGVEADFEVIFDHTKTRRMKTEIHQTDFLLLNKGRASMDYGFLWKFYVYLQAFHFWKGLSLKFAYEYAKHDSDSLTPKDNQFNSMIANTARSLDEWYSHNLIFSMNYDFFKEIKCCKPQIHFFFKLPVGGKRIIYPWTLGGQLAFNF